jgi:hypothetical protein
MGLAKIFTVAFPLRAIAKTELERVLSNYENIAGALNVFVAHVVQD